MAKDDNQTQDTTTAEPAAAKPQAKPELPINLGVYCAGKGLPQRHLPGMQAYTHVRYATYAQWEQISRRTEQEPPDDPTSPF